METKKEFKLFEDFTNLYEVQKTLRFELKPVGKTKELIDANKVLEKDKLIDDNYHNIKYYFDLLHRRFIIEALAETKFNLKNYYKIFHSLDKKSAESQRQLRQAENDLRELIVKKFDDKANEWKIKYNGLLREEGQKLEKKSIQLKKDGLGILFEKDNLEILRLEFPQKPSGNPSAPEINFTDPQTGEIKNLFESFRGLTTYFSNFNQSRNNFYSEKDKDTAVANRIINENLRRFCENKKLFDGRKKEYGKLDLSGEEKEIFVIDFYNSCLTQKGIDRYNEIIGRKSSKENEGEKGLNQKINEYRQKTKEKLPLFKQLDNQILSEKDRKFKEIEIGGDGEVFPTLKEFMLLNDGKMAVAGKLIDKFFSKQEDYDLEKIYLKKSAINTLSRKLFGDNYLLFENALPHRGTSSKEEKYKLPDFISIQEIKDALSGIQKDKKELPKGYKYLGKIELPPEDLFKADYTPILVPDNYPSFLNIWRSEFKKCFSKCDETREKALKMIADNKEYVKNDTQIEIIKEYADASLDTYRMMKYFALEKGRKKISDLDGDSGFYNEFESYCADYPINTYYNEFRNYLSKKDFMGRLLFPSFNASREQKNPRSKRKIDGAEKIKLNFDATYDHKWGGLAFLFKKNDSYLIGVPVKGAKFDIAKLKLKLKLKQNNPNDFFLIEPKQLKFKTLVGKGYLGKYGISYGKQEDAIAINNAKEIIKERYLKNWPLLESILGKEYESKKDFYKDVSKILDDSYCLKPTLIDEDSLMEANSNDRIHLFQIYSKDFSQKTNGKPNIQTQYFKMLFNCGKTIKLNSAFEIYFRPKKDNLPPKADKSGKTVTDHKRYADDKYFLHLSIILNFGKDKIKNDAKFMIGYAKKFNTRTNESILKNDDVKIIGIDRGENNLAYYSVINTDGKIIESGSFNDIEMKDAKGKTVKTVLYAKLLREKAGKRDEARKNWQTIENIKELKNGYVSQVIRKICDLVVNHKAMVVFEDLNSGFKRSRSALDFPVYQKLEMALIKKLNYLTNKNTEEGSSGHYLKGYQLAPPVATPQDVGKQTGIVFYTPAGYTSKTCPICGFRKNHSKFYYETIEKVRDTVGRLRRFEFDKNQGRFEIEYSLSDFLSEEEKKKAKKSAEKDNALFSDHDRKDIFTTNSDVVRFRWHDNKTERAKTTGKGEVMVENSKTARGLVKKYQITQCLIDLFEKYDIDYRNANLKNLLLNGRLDKNFYKDLLYYLNLIMEIRNSWKDNDGNSEDYIQCPCCDFNSSKEFKENHFQGFEWNGDANGAYNIARKGILILKKIRQFVENNNDLSKLGWRELSVNIEEWDKFVQKSSDKK